MEPSTTPFREAPPATTCYSCDGPLEPDQRIRCLLCQRAAALAVEELPGQVIRPSDVARIRARLAKGA